MKSLKIAQLATAADLPAALASVQPGALFALPMPDGRFALLTFSAVHADAIPPEGIVPRRIRDSYVDLERDIIELCADGYSVNSACEALAYAGRIPGHATELNKAQDLGKWFRARHSNKANDS
jgi:hypothetical protein